MKWVETYRINANDADVNDAVSASGVLRYMQDTANCQMEGEGPSYRELLDRGLAFVVSRLRLSLYNPLRAHDVIESETWTTPSKGAIFNRCFRIKKDGMIMAEAATCWALVGIENRKIYRVSEVDFSYGGDEPLELDAPARIRVPDEVSLRLAGERKVEYADVDVNGHMNNTKYPDFLAGWAAPMKGRRAVSMGISFRSEAPLGCTLKVYRGELDGVHYVRSVKESGEVNAEAEIIFEEI
ncbi:MAG: hypothetical protein IIZ35_03735 [Clostridia bacterium]|nr:hypothetical protein [Clostridia bacterium]